MPLSKEGKTLTTNLYQFKKYGSRRTVTEFSKINCKTEELDMWKAFENQKRRPMRWISASPWNSVVVSACLLAKRPQADDHGRRRRPSNPPRLLCVDHPRIGPACDGCTDVGWETPVNYMGSSGTERAGKLVWKPYILEERPGQTYIQACQPPMCRCAPM